jgi:hypothetical protein
MRVSVSADERVGIADAVVEELRKRGHEPIPPRGAQRLRATSEAELAEILDAWFSAEPSGDEDDRSNVEHLAELDG